MIWLKEARIRFALPLERELTYSVNCAYFFLLTFVCSGALLTRPREIFGVEIGASVFVVIVVVVAVVSDDAAVDDIVVSIVSG